MSKPLVIDPAWFSPGAAPKETVAHAEALIAKGRNAPDIWALGPREVRARRQQGETPFVIEPPSARAQTIEIDGPGGKLPLRIIAPARPAGAYLHIHSGGWTLGSADQDDPRLDRLADEAGLACVSVEYRLAPEFPYPAAPDDCEAAALWLVREAAPRFGVQRLAIGGESAGANLAAVTLLRLRDRHGLTPFSAANLTAGSFDLGLTPSARCSEKDRLILSTRDLRLFAAAYVQNGQSLADPDISPLYANLAGMPPALFTCGTRDPLIDDTLFMAARWTAAGRKAELSIWPGSAHVHTSLPEPNGAAANDRIVAFLKG
ncbi:alpha/beta hydrolase [Hansschlegelia quercus]|uniref:Alpha/beta hydrolase n=1 Tax=Hansschlegelia quercus TaxID=2528245 RepID=A0A4Q9GK39_9HYPH|nr:alpha/beta hydrolase [Hansschlegelia quercus]TBN52427.1 alpha/beta hydrolase [Hansschlegelia quercus]